MKKSSHWVGVFAMGICSASVVAGCSAEDPATPMGMAGTGTGGSTGTAGSGGTSAGPAGVQLQSPAYHVVLKGADAAAGMPAPAAYKTAGCNSCHGENGEGNLVGPEIRFTPKDYAVAVVRGGRKTPNGMLSAMVAFPATGTASVSDADLDAINTWQNSFTKPATGEGLYKAMCGNCHGPMTPTGGSAPVGIQGKPKVEVAQYVRNGNGTDMTMRATYMPKFDTTLLTDAELALIETYLGSM
ncbi:MAG TPA: cytochrome c [Polyangiaceae bacterium]|nr:cytochrome c [Polyangiaceae bacterium]